jgi:[ribosomal protein S5]-alanine N-acetyltransferase
MLGNLVCLRRALPEDAVALFQVAADAEVMRYMDWEMPRTSSEVRTHLEAVSKRWDEGIEYQWVVSPCGSDDLAGTISCRPNGHAVDFGYFFATAHWGRGFATEAGTLVLGHLRMQPECIRIWATADVENQRSHKLLERLGLSREGVLRQAMLRPNIGGPPRDTVVYAWCRGDA